MATKNAINNTSNPLASSAVTVDPGASGDSYIQFDINGTGEFRIGVDDDAADSFKISQGSALGANDTFIMTSAGERTMPLQPAFLALLGTTDSNVTGNAATYTLGTGNALTEIFDQNNDFNTNGTFTASVAGRYILGGSVKIGDITAAMTDALIIITTTSIDYQTNFDNCAVLRDTSDEKTVQIATVADMDAADTAIMQIIIWNGAGDTADIIGQATNPCTFFYGYLAV